MEMMRMKKFFCGWLLCSLLVVQAVAQSSFRVTGKVIDRPSRQPVVGAFVSPASIDTVRAVTDTAGVFVLPHVPPGIFSLRVTAAGFVPQEAPEYNDSEVTPEVKDEKGAAVES